jgi:hypothetical protein
MNNNETNNIELKNLEATLFEINHMFQKQINDALLLEEALIEMDKNLMQLAEEEKNIIARMNTLKNT